MPGDRWKNHQIIDALKATNGLVSLAARNLGCSAVTIYNRAKRVPSVQQVIDESREGLVDLAELALRRAIVGSPPKDGHPGIEPAGWAVALVCRTLGRKRGYVEKSELDVTSAGEPIRFVEVVRPQAPEPASE